MIFPKTLVLMTLDFTRNGALFRPSWCRRGKMVRLSCSSWWWRPSIEYQYPRYRKGVSGLIVGRGTLVPFSSAVGGAGGGWPLGTQYAKVHFAGFRRCPYASRKVVSMSI